MNEKKLLKEIEKMGLKRKDVWIVRVVGGYIVKKSENGNILFTVNDKE